MLKFSEETISLGTVISYSAVTFYYHLENKALIYDRHRWNLSPYHGKYRQLLPRYQK